MYNDSHPVIDEAIDKTLSVIKEIDILMVKMERRNDKERINDMLLLREELVQSVEKMTRNYFPLEE